MPRISIIVPVFNRADVLGRAVKSAQAQTVGDWEMVIVDDGSTDGSADVAEQFAAGDSRIRVIRLERNGGANAARVRAIRESTGEWIAPLDSDDEWLPHRLESQFRVIEEWKSSGRGEPGVVYTWVRIIWINGTETIVEEGTDGDVYVALLARFFGWTSSLLIRRDIYERAGGFDANSKLADEYDFSLRASRLCSYAVVREPVVIIHRRGDGKMCTEGTISIIDRYASEIRRHHGRRRLAALRLYWGEDLLRRGNRRLARTQFLKCVALSPRCGKAWRHLLGFERRM